MMSKSVILELEWVMRGYYSLDHTEVAAVMRHLLEQSQIKVQSRDAVKQALADAAAGITTNLAATWQALTSANLPVEPVEPRSSGWHRHGFVLVTRNVQDTQDLGVQIINAWQP